MSATGTGPSRPQRSKNAAKLQVGCLPGKPIAEAAAHRDVLLDALGEAGGHRVTSGQGSATSRNATMTTLAYTLRARQGAVAEQVSDLLQARAMREHVRRERVAQQIRATNRRVDPSTIKRHRTTSPTT